MRTIKFRGKDVFTDAWRYGDLVHNQKVTITSLTPRTMVGVMKLIPLLSGNSLVLKTRMVRKFTRVTLLYLIQPLSR